MVIDIIILVIALAAIITGAVSGLIKQLGILFAFVVGILACRMFSPGFARMVHAESTWATAGCFVAVFVVAFLVTVLLARLLKATVHALKLGPVDRVLGALFRLVLWFAIVSVCLNLYFGIVPQQKAEYLNAQKPWRGWILDSAPYIVGYMGFETNQ